MLQKIIIIIDAFDSLTFATAYYTHYVHPEAEPLTERSVVALLDAPIASSKVTASGSNSCQKTHIITFIRIARGR